MRPVAERLEELTGAQVTLAPAVTGAEVSKLTEGLAPGEMLMLENIRYEPGETHNDQELVRRSPSSRTSMWTMRSGAPTRPTRAGRASPTGSRAPRDG